VFRTSQYGHRTAPDVLIRPAPCFGKRAVTRFNVSLPLLAASLGSHGDPASTMVAPPVMPDRPENLPRPAASPPDDPTRTAHSLAAPTTQVAVAPALLRTPDRYQILNEHGRGGLGKVIVGDFGETIVIDWALRRTSAGACPNGSATSHVPPTAAIESETNFEPTCG